MVCGKPGRFYKISAHTVFSLLATRTFIFILRQDEQGGTSIQDTPTCQAKPLYSKGSPQQNRNTAWKNIINKYCYNRRNKGNHKRSGHWAQERFSLQVHAVIECTVLCCLRETRKQRGSCRGIWMSLVFRREKNRFPFSGHWLGANITRPLRPHNPRVRKIWRGRTLPRAL